MPGFWPSGIHKTKTTKLIKRVIVPILKLIFKEIPWAKTLHGEAPVNETINKLDVEARKKFVDTFEKIKKNIGFEQI